MNQFAQLDRQQGESAIRFRQPVLLKTKSNSFLSSACTSAGSHSNYFGKHVILGFRNNADVSSTSDIELPLPHSATIFTGTHRVLCNHTDKPQWMEESKTTESNWTIVQSKTPTSSSFTSWLPAFLQRGSTRSAHYREDNSGQLCFLDTVHLVATPLSSAPKYLTLTGQLTTRLEQAASFVLHTVTLEQLNSLSSSLSRRQQKKEQRMQQLQQERPHQHDGVDDPQHPQCRPPLNFPLHLLPNLLRSYVPNGLAIVRVLSKEFERTTHSFVLAAQNGFSPTNTRKLLDFVQRKCNRVQALRLRNFDALKECDVVTALSPLHRRSILRSVDLCGCPLVGDGVCAKLCQTMHTLRALKLACTSITDEGLDMLCTSKATSTLVHLNVYGCQDLTVQGMNASLSKLIERDASVVQSMNLRGTGMTPVFDSLRLKRVAQDCGVRVLIGPMREDGGAFFSRK